MEDAALLQALIQDDTGLVRDVLTQAVESAPTEEVADQRRLLLHYFTDAHFRTTFGDLVSQVLTQSV